MHIIAKVFLDEVEVFNQIMTGEEDAKELDKLSGHDIDSLHISFMENVNSQKALTALNKKSEYMHTLIKCVTFNLKTKK